MVTNLTNDMIRLCGEIAALRDSRAQDRSDRKEAVSQMQAKFRKDLKEMAGKTKADLREFVASVKPKITNLRQVVADFRAEFLADFAGAQRAWRGAAEAVKARLAAEEPLKDITPKGKKKKR